MTKTQQKETKPETLTSLQIELTEHLFELETCSYCGEDKATEEYMIKGGSANWIELDFCPKCIDTLRAAQKKIIITEDDNILTDYAHGYCDGKRVGEKESMAQGKKETLDELEGELENVEDEGEEGAAGCEEIIRGWISAKRAEAQKQEARKG